MLNNWCRRVWCAGVAAVVVAGVALGHFGIPSTAPISRLVSNLERMLKDRPDDSHVEYLLGRVHAMAFAGRCRELSYYERGGLPELVQHGGWGSAAGSPGNPPMTSAELVVHAEESVKHLQRAVELTGKGDISQLGFAYALEQAAGLAIDVKVLPAIAGSKAAVLSDVRKGELQKLIDALSGKDAKEAEKAEKSLLESLGEAAPLLHAQRESFKGEGRTRAKNLLKRHWLRIARAGYVAAFDSAYATESKMCTETPMGGLECLVSYESAKAIVRLDAADEPTEKLSKEKHDAVAAAVKKYEALPPCSVITPVVLPVTGRGWELSDLVDEEASVAFDLDGTGRAQRWSWVKPNAGLLVWDRDGTGEITSGRDLFGAVTWWLLPGDGFTAMSLLDDNGDGWLSGKEFEGLAVWIDVDGNGVCGKGEVVTLWALGVEALRVRADCMTGDAPTALRGVRMRDGSVRPLYDWIAKSKPAVKSDAKVGGTK
ncbi:MAG: hypothetical protein QM783_08530 [Phycisphaerales bacterium]